MLNKKNSQRQIVLFFTAVLLIAGSTAFAGVVTVPPEVQESLTNVKNAFTGDIAKIIVGTCFAGSCIAYAYNKDNEKMKSKVIAVAIASGLLGISQSVVEKLVEVKG